MLGSIKHKTGWIWYASGKHPAAKDFLEIGTRDPLLQAFANWVAGGFRQWANHNDCKNARNSWRFWTKSAHKQQLLCGISRDSCDSFGRSFPLVVVGSGHLRKWQTHWEMLPLVLDKTWQQMEYLATRRQSDFNHLEDEVRLLPYPTENWTGLSSSAEASLAPLQPRVDRSDPLVGTIPLVNVTQNELPGHLCLLHTALKKRSKQPPNAVFMGGVPEKSSLVAFNRPLRGDDFDMLWASCPVPLPASGSQ